MLLEFKDSGDLVPYWDNYLNRVWEASGLIQVIYSLEPGRLLVELSGSERIRAILDDKGTYHCKGRRSPDLEMLSITRRIFWLAPWDKFFRGKNGTIHKINAYDKKPDKYSLSITLQKEITSYLHYHLPLCIILGNSCFIPWFQSHFTSLCLREDFQGTIQKKGMVRADYLESKFLFSEIATTTNLSYKSLQSMIVDIIDYVSGKIAEGFYVIIYLDEYYIRHKTFTDVTHFVHQSLIYGYDMEKEVFLAVGFDMNNLLTLMEYSFDEFRVAYANAGTNYTASCPWSEMSAISLFRLKKFRKYPQFNSRKFCRTIKAYLDSQPDPQKVNNIYDGENITYGIALYEEFNNLISNRKNNGYLIDYRFFHIIHERAHAFLSRLHYIHENYLLKNGLEEIIKEYESLTKILNGIRLGLLKLNLKKNREMRDMYEIDDDFDTEHCKEQLKKFFLAEKICLTRVLALLSGQRVRKKRNKR